MSGIPNPTSFVIEPLFVSGKWIIAVLQGKGQPDEPMNFSLSRMIECECGNKITLSVPPKKYLQLRDNLETKKFRYDGEKAKDGKVEEFRISCGKCKNWIDIGVD